MTSNRFQSDLQPSLLRRSTRYASASLLLGSTLLISGCLDRPIGNSRPVTTNVVIQKQTNDAINAIDLLLMIDNSSSMADKQKTLADAVPQLLTQLVQPSCVDTNNVVTGTRVTLGGGCPVGSSPEFNPVNNIHIGIVTSSLGDHGQGNLCTPGTNTTFTDANGASILKPADVNDASHLVGTLARYTSTTAPQPNVTTDAEGFLAWGNSTKPAMKSDDLTSASGIFKDMVTSTKEMGCGLEAQLEGWFRFLIDPVPPIYPITKDKDSSQAQRKGSDNALLAQRAAFLRPDSLVAIVMLTDENDCSLRDTDVGWVAADTSNSIKTGSSQCDANPNDPCCYSCTTGAPSGCTNGCPNPVTNAKDDSPYQANIRCWHQKRRFGYEFMYPTSRYVVGLTNPMLCPDQSFGDMDCDCTYANNIHASCNPGTRKMPNPLYGSIVGYDNDNNQVNSVSSGIPRTDNSVIFLAGIVGVPWQDIGYKDAAGNLVYIPVTDSSWTGAPTAGGVAPITPAPATGIWDNIYADDNDNGKVPADPHMIESIEARSGITAYDNIEHEWNTAYQDLEYACIYPLPESKKCACDSSAADYATCKYQNPNDCCDLTFTADGRGTAQPTGGTAFNKPLCTGNTQVNAKGYPGLREIGVLHDYAIQAPIKGNSIVASICPADVKSTDKTGAGYGYNPAVAALVTRLKEKLKGSCLPRQLSVRADGTVPCSVVEVVSMSDMSGCDAFCNTNLRQPVAATNPMRQAVLESMKSSGLCDKANSNTPCSSMCLCELGQESNSIDAWGKTDDLTTCQNADEGTVDKLYPGYCYVDPYLRDADGNPVAGTNTSLVENCPTTQRRILRFAGNDPTGSNILVPLSGAMVYTACQGSSLTD
jgi:hypothetical protein